jgi:hypothetical protein
VEIVIMPSVDPDFIIEIKLWGRTVLGDFFRAALRAAEEALALANRVAKARPGFPTKTYEDRIRQIKAAMEKDKKQG